MSNEKSFHSFVPLMEMKERILTKAEELFSRYGIKSVTMDEIANQLGISKKTIYLSFVDKDELVLEVFSSFMEENKKICLQDQQVAENAIHEIFLAMDMTDSMLKSLNVSLLFDLEKYHPATYHKFKSYKEEFFYKLVNANLQRGLKEELYRPDLNIEVICRMRLGMMMLSMNIELFPPHRFTLTEVEREIILHYVYGIATAKGNKLIQKYSLQRQKTKA